MSGGSVRSSCLSPSAWARVDQTCDRFEEAWQAEKPPLIEVFLDQAFDDKTATTERSLLLRELLQLELEFLRQLRRPVSAQQYRTRFPGHEELVDEIFVGNELPEAESGTPDQTGPPDGSLPSAVDPNETELHAERARGEHTQLTPRPGSPHGRTSPVRRFSHPSPHAKLLARTWPFLELPAGVLHALLDNVAEREYDQGQPLVRQGEPCEHLLILVEGTAEVHLQSEERCHEVAELKAGAIIGEMSLVTNEPCTATVAAKTAAVALTLSVERFHQLAARHHVLWLMLNHLVARRLGQEAVDVLSGKTLHGYRIVGCLARGGMAVVYEARDLANHRRVALKMMSHRLTHDLEAQSRFDRELDISQSLLHPNICRIHDRFTAFGTNFMVMEFCDGVALSSVIEHHGPLDEDAARGILGQLAHALAYAHDRGVLHRDLKPANIMINRDGTLKLLDFGLAKSALSAELTCDGHVLGTPRYMPPEQLAGRPVDHRADLFALGCITYELIVGRPLFPERDMLAILTRQMSGPILPDDRFPAGISPELEQVLRQTLTVAPEDRVLNVQQLCDWAQKADPALLEQPEPNEKANEEDHPVKPLDA